MFFSNNDTELNVSNMKAAAKRFIDMEAGEEDELGNVVRSLDDEGNDEDLDSFDPNLIATENLEEDAKGQSRQARMHAKMMDHMDDEETELIKSRFVDNDAIGMYKARLNQGQWGGHSSAVRSQSLLLSTDITGESVPTLNGRGRSLSMKGFGFNNGDDFDSYDSNLGEDMSNLSSWERHVKINSLPLLKNRLNSINNSDITQDATEVNEAEDEEERIRLQKQARLRLKYPQLCAQSSEDSRSNKYTDIDLGYEDESSVGIACLDDDNKIVYPKMPALMRSISDNNKSIPYLKRKRSLHTPVLNNNNLLDKMNSSRLGSNSISVDPNSPQVSMMGANGPSTGVKDFSLFNQTISSGSAENTPKFLPRPSFLMRSITASDKSLDSFSLTGTTKPNATKDISCKMNSANAVSKKFIFMNVERTNSLSSNSNNKSSTNKPKDIKNKENKSEKANNKK